MARNFPDFLDAYFSYVNRDRTPDAFHLWAGISLISALCERKILFRREPFVTRPNMYIFLVSRPGIGKSLATKNIVELLEKMEETYGSEIVQLPTTGSVAGMVDYIQNNQHSFQTTGYFIAGEGENSLFDTEHGNFPAIITDFWDCPDLAKKQLVGKKTELKNISFNLIAGFTYAFLKNVLNRNSIRGGLASRVIYVSAREKKDWVRQFHNKVEDQTAVRDKLVDDMNQIYKLSGSMSCTAEFEELYLDWEQVHEKLEKDTESEQLLNMIVRRPMNFTKLCMVMSLSRTNSLIINADDFHRAKGLLDQVNMWTEDIIMEAMLGNKEDYEALYRIIVLSIGAEGESKPMSEIYRQMMVYSADASRIGIALETARKAEMIESLDSGKSVRLLKNPYK